MGQRSQIYIRYNVNYEMGSATKHPYTQNYKGLIARYYPWNYGERMISRARYIIRYIIETLQAEYLGYEFLFGDSTKLEKLKRICDVNFDKKDIIMSDNIIEEWKEQFPDSDFNEAVFFEPNNNDGQLFIDVTNDGIKYCFMKLCVEGEPMDAAQYMEWDCENEDHPDWHVPCKYMNEETIEYTERNIEEIGKMATLMTMEELKSFVEDDYSYLGAPLF